LNQVGVTSISKNVSDQIFVDADKNKNGVLEKDEFEAYVMVSKTAGDNYKKWQDYETFWLQEVNKKSIDYEYLASKNVLPKGKSGTDQIDYMISLGARETSKGSSEYQISKLEFVAFMLALEQRDFPS